MALFIGTAIAAPIFLKLHHNKKKAEKESTVASQPAAPDPQRSEWRPTPEYAVFSPPPYARDHSYQKETVLVWGGDHQYTEGLAQKEEISNIRKVDYAGAASCAECHEENYELWSEHSHRWMNVPATEESVKGDFSGGERARLRYLGGTGEFFREDDGYRMRLNRDEVTRTFQVRRTLGSRIHQYYIGRLLDGPEPEDDPLRHQDHVLPFGLELTMEEWIPIVHARGHEGPDAARDDPFTTPSRLPYDTHCSLCHTTPPFGNQMLAMFKRFAAYSPRKLHFEGSNYIDETDPGAVRMNVPTNQRLTRETIKAVINDLTDQSQELMKEENLVNYGISCESCHLGSKAHVENESIKPFFFPSGPYVHTDGKNDNEIWGRSAANKNFACARCHSGSRPQYAAGMATWNSTEFTDARRGHCYDPPKAEAHGMKSLTCVSCHNPHETIGRRWKKDPARDRHNCVKCHTKYENETIAMAHTRHPVGSSGSDCMNCHMPKINEGMGDMVRTHTIFKPTNVKMLEANQPNACNMCHVEKSIDWTLQHFSEWYGLNSSNTPSTGATTASRERTYSASAIATNYPNRGQSAALGWLSSAHTGTRMVGTDVLLKARAEWALADLIPILDDPYMEVRQFTVQRLRDYFDINTDDFGYKLYMTEEEREEPIQRMMEALVETKELPESPPAN
ncbi:MAG: multiheme c-type cytochrome [Verrucomicrobiota bacterium]